MTLHTIIWDFDGTLYPLCPYDSEQTLLQAQRTRSRQSLPTTRSFLTALLIHMDRLQWFKTGIMRRLYMIFYGRVLAGTPAPLLDVAAAEIAGRMMPGDIETLRELYEKGIRMLVISCGTLDLSEKIIQKAGVRECFESIKANPLRLRDNVIIGVESRVVTAADKLSVAKELTGNAAQGVAAVGDGYTDIPLLDWAQYPVMIDPDRSKQSRYAGKPYFFADSVSAVPRILTLD